MTLEIEINSSESQPSIDDAGITRNCKALNNALGRFVQPTVIAVDGPWGCGKTYFLKNWEECAEHQVIYLDAFQCDFLEDPLASLVQAVSRVDPASLKTKALGVMRRILPIVSKSAIRIATLNAVNEFSEIGDELAKISGY